VARAATGHKYWSRFSPDIQDKISIKSKSIYKSLFSPEVPSPVKTIDLPLGGTTSISHTLDLLISLCEIVDSENKELDKLPEDITGDLTLNLLVALERVVGRLVGNQAKSLGLHPFVYFYTSKGRHYPPLMLAMFAIVSEKLKSNDKKWFKDFSENRESIEEILLEHKGIITLLLSAMASKSRVTGGINVLNLIIERAKSGAVDVLPNDFADVTGLESRLYTIQSKPGASFDDDAKSSAFLQQAFAQALKCPLCGGYLDPAKSVSYDHIVRKADGGAGGADNCQLTHPYCNTCLKN
jgi:hypothetical protein